MHFQDFILDDISIKKLSKITYLQNKLIIKAVKKNTIDTSSSNRRTNFSKKNNLNMPKKLMK